MYFYSPFKAELLATGWWISGFVLRHPIVSSVVMGATNLQQLQVILSAIHVNISDKILAEVDAVHEQFPNPTP